MIAHARAGNLRVRDNTHHGIDPDWSQHPAASVAQIHERKHWFGRHDQSLNRADRIQIAEQQRDYPRTADGCRCRYAVQARGLNRIGIVHQRRPASISVTAFPAWVSVTAADSPAIPAPTTAMCDGMRTRSAPLLQARP